MSENEQAAHEFGNHWPSVKKRLKSAQNCLTREAAAIFAGGRFDRENRRYVSPCGRYALQWRLRDKPDQPVGYHNQQTRCGDVAIKCLVAYADLTTTKT